MIHHHDKLVITLKFVILSKAKDLLSASSAHYQKVRVGSYELLTAKCQVLSAKCQLLIS